MLNPLPIYIGYDPSEAIAANVLAFSIQRRASKPVAITFLMLDQLKEVHNRERHPLQSTEFSFTRFLTPYLNGYKGDAIFLDCDMLMLDDIYRVVDEASSTFAAACVVKHNHKPINRTKMQGQLQTVYNCKNWSSFILFRCQHSDCGRLTPEYVNTAEGLELHQFKWTKPSIVGRLPHRWNHLVGYDQQCPLDEISCLHWTEGGPWWESYKDAPYADVWREELREMNKAWERKREAA